MHTFRETYIGDWKFYKHVCKIAIPLILQAMITNFVSMLDNIMVGKIGTAQMSGVSIVNIFVSIFFFSNYGANAGATIFGTQFFGKKDYKGQAYTVRFRLILSSLLIIAFILVLKIWGAPLISCFLSKDDSPELVSQTLYYGEQYLSIIAFSLIPNGIGQAFTSVLREIEETKIPMYGSAAAIGVNLILDYGLIFGRLGMPKMGVIGAAIATLIAKCIEALVIILWIHTHPEKNPYLKELYQSFYIPKDLFFDILIKGCPLLLNEIFWSLGTSVTAWCYSVRGLDVVAARNIACTITNLFSVVQMQIGVCVGIIIGALLGAGELEKAKDTDNKLSAFSVMAATCVMLILIPLAFVFPNLYNTESTVKHVATYYIIIQALALPFIAYANACYFTLRSGGRTGITILFDCVFTWVVTIPLAFCLVQFTNLSFQVLFAIVSLSCVLQAIIGYYLIKSDIWLRNIVDK